MENRIQIRYSKQEVYTKSTEYEEKTETEDIETGELTLNADGYAIEAKYESNHDGDIETYQISYQDGYAITSERIEAGSNISKG